MLPVIVSFDPDLPIVTSREVTVGGRVFGADEPFPWRELGIDLLTLHSFYRAGYVRCEATPAVVAAPAEQSGTASSQPSKRSQQRR